MNTNLLENKSLFVTRRVASGCVITVMLFVFCFTGMAQQVRSSYFMDNLATRNKLNPAFQPDRGYFNIPLIGSLGIAANSNTLTVENFSDIFGGEDNSFLFDDEFMNQLKEDNRMNVDFSTDILSFGFYAGKGFWTIDVGVRGLANTSIPKSMFEFARNRDDVDLQQSYEIRNLHLNFDLFGEVALGYSRPVNERLTVGGKLKVLLGAANLNTKINRLSLDAANNEWHVSSDGEMNIALKGLQFSDDEGEEEYISDLDFDTPGISGYGVGVDLGATYKLMDNLTLSAAIIDLGFVKWSASASTRAVMNQSHTISIDGSGDWEGERAENNSGYDEGYDNGSDEDWNDGSYDDYYGGGDVFDLDLFQFQKTKSGGYTSTLRSTLNIGAEYAILNDKIGFGLLSSTRFLLPKAYSELTASVNFRPKRWFGATLSYSFINSNFKTFGFGLKLGALFIGTDYMLTNSITRTNMINAYLGISIPLGKRKPV